jgi:endoglycosylceramidase
MKRFQQIIKEILMALDLRMISMMNYIRNNFQRPVISETNFIHDEFGRIINLRGLNISNYQKYSSGNRPWHTYSDFTRMRDWGFNFVRYLVFWSAVEPTAGNYNDAYIDACIDDLNSLRNAGMYTIVDFHQDLVSGMFPPGDGFPNWAVDNTVTLPWPFNNTRITVPYQMPPWSPWAANYLQPAVIAAENNFWGRRSDLRNAYCNAMKHFAQRMQNVFRSTYPRYDLGIEMINEPMPGTTVGFESNVLKNFYQSGQAVMDQTETQQTLPHPLDVMYKYKLFFQPWMGTSAGIPSALGYRPAPFTGVYSPHYYDTIATEGNGTYTWFNKFLMEQAVRIKVAESQSFNCPIIFGEFGIADTVTNYLDYVRDFINVCEQYNVGWAYYSYDKNPGGGFGVVDNSGNEKPVLQSLVRVYAKLIAGTAPKQAVNGKRYNLSYTTSAIPQPTVIFIPPSLTGVQIVVNGSVVSYSDNLPYHVYNHVNNMSFATQNITITWN